MEAQVQLCCSCICLAACLFKVSRLNLLMSSTLAQEGGAVMRWKAWREQRSRRSPRRQRSC